MSVASARPTWRDWAPVIAIVLTLASAILIFGGMLNELRTDSADIAEMKAHQQQMEQRYDATLSQIQITTARTDATLQALRDRNGQLKP